jgi:hypothetical protein
VLSADSAWGSDGSPGRCLHGGSVMWSRRVHSAGTEPARDPSPRFCTRRITGFSRTVNLETSLKRHKFLIAVVALCFLPLASTTAAQNVPRDPAQRGLTNFQRAEPPKNAAPAPRRDGRVLLGTPEGNGGMWTPLFGTTSPILEYEKVPFQPWAKALYVDRQGNELEPHTRCHPSGVARQFLTPYGVQFVEIPELQQIYIFDEGGPHTFRTIYMDGRSHPQNLVPTYYGHSIGWWEGDTLVVDSIGYNERFWLDRRGLPHTEKLHTLERFTRLDATGMKYEATIDDPDAYTQPWTGWFYMRFDAKLDPWEYICQQNDQAPELMLGNFKTMDRSTAIVP